MVPSLTSRALRLAILEVLAKDGRRAVNRFNLLGRGTQRGTLEHHLGVEFDAPARQQAFREVEQLGKEMGSLLDFALRQRCGSSSCPSRVKKSVRSVLSRVRCGVRHEY